MPQEDRDETREDRIDMEVIPDAYAPEEQALGWYYYLEDNVQFPFEARCITERATSPLENGEEVRVVGMPAEEVCTYEMFVRVEWRDRELAVPLMQLEPIAVDSDTQQVIEDWHYWVDRGYELY